MAITLFLMIWILFFSKFYPVSPVYEPSQKVKYQGEVQEKRGHPYEDEIEQESINCQITDLLHRSIEMCPPVAGSGNHIYGRFLSY